MQTTLTSKGRMTLPIAVRTRLGFESGDHLMVTIQDDDTIILKRPPSAGVTLAHVRALIKQADAKMVKE